MGNKDRGSRAAVLASAILALGVSPAFGTDRDFTLHNHTHRTIKSLAVSPTGEERWSADILGQDILDDHTDLVVKFYAGESQCDWDVRVEFEDGTSEQVHDVDLCADSDVTFTR